MRIAYQFVYVCVRLRLLSRLCVRARACDRAYFCVRGSYAFFCLYRHGSGAHVDDLDCVCLLQAVCDACVRAAHTHTLTVDASSNPPPFPVFGCVGVCARARKCAYVCA